jgi:hypothetical protein
MNFGALYVFYTGSGEWTYTGLPSGWVFACSTENPTSHFFNGPASTRDSARSYLQDFFTTLQTVGKVTTFKIEDRYNP